MTENTVESVRRALDLLRELNRQRVSSVRHLHHATGLPKPTIVRMLDTFAALGYVVNDRRQGGYQVTSLVRSLSAGFHGDPLVVEAARPWAIAFTRKFQWPVAVAVLDRDAVAVRFSTIPDSPVSPFHVTINNRLKLMSRALGRAYIAFCPPNERNLLLRMLAMSDDPEDEAARDRDAALTLLAMVRRAGFADRSATVEPKSSSTIAVPVMLGRKVLATVGVTYFTSAIPKAEAIARYVPLLKEMAKNIQTSVVLLEQGGAPNDGAH
ncbi:MAG: DNA-binding transcriptional regulator [Rhodoplanes sp.]|uniref:DNA-binding transcriptional regulator n=1 Tax=Rhodoplanes sp. TaxID=1968906 RepID=UPI00184CE941|nr:DNA-binding transcriptional regulator [Rhodoplanes sp.]NVO12787.1 DNA-binding transcriptional regulator [Rhodoplanes sp.]